MIFRTVLAAAAALAAAACAETPQDKDQAAQAPAASGAAADTSATSPMTVNPAPKGQSLPSTPPTLPEDPAQQDKSMPPGPVNPGEG